MGLNLGVNGKNGKYPFFMRKSQNGKGTDEAFGKVMIMTRILKKKYTAKPRWSAPAFKGNHS